MSFIKDLALYAAVCFALLLHCILPSLQLYCVYSFDTTMSKLIYHMSMIFYIHIVALALEAKESIQYHVKHKCDKPTSKYMRIICFTLGLSIFIVGLIALWLLQFHPEPFNIWVTPFIYVYGFGAIVTFWIIVKSVSS